MIVYYTSCSKQNNPWFNSMWILRLRVLEDVQAIQQQLAPAQEIKRMVAKGGDRPKF
jgi:hypothetical protein